MHRGGGGGGGKAYAPHRDPDDDADWSGSKHHKGHRRASWRRGGRGPAGASAMLWTALVAGVFLLFLATFMDVTLNPFFGSRRNQPASLVSTSSSSSTADESPAAAAAPAAGRAQKHERQEAERPGKKKDEVEQQPAKMDAFEEEEGGAEASPSRSKKHKRQAPKQPQPQEEEDEDEEEPVAAAAVKKDVDAAVAAFLERARRENTEKRVQLSSSNGSGGDGGDDAPIETLPRVAVLFYPTEQPAALALTKALETALLVDDEDEDPIAVEEVLAAEAAEAAGEEDGWLIRVEGDRLAAAHDGSTTAAPSDFLLWFTSRVPPYGYGKSHGLRGVVRLLAFPPVHPLESESDVRDFVRWHCRISHVTAHTPTLTLEVGSGEEEEDSDWAERLWGFVGLGPASLPAAQDALRDELAAAGVTGSDDDDDDGWLRFNQEEEEEDDDDDGHGGLFQLEEAEEEEEEEGEGDEEEGPLPRELLAVFMEEVAVMAQWPCGQFEDSQLAPACHLTSWVHCSVPWDVCGKASCDGAEAEE